MDLRYLLLIFRSRLSLILSCMVVCGAIGLGAALLLHKQQATATILVRTPITEAGGNRTGPAATPAASAIEVLSSPAVARRVIESLRLGPDHPLVRTWGTPDLSGGTMEDWLVSRLQKETRFAASPEGNVVSVTASAKERKLAADLADTFAATYLDVSREVQAEGARARAGQIMKGMPRIEQDLQAARTSMVAFRNAHPEFSPDERNNASVTTLAALTAQLATVQADLSAGSRGADDAHAAALQGLQADVTRARSRWIEASSKYGSNHPLNLQAAEDLKQAEAALRLGASGIDRANGSKAASLREAIRRQEQGAVRQSALAEEYSGFQRALMAAETAANTARGALRQARLESEAALDTATILSRAMPVSGGPLDPWKRALPLGVALGLLLGSVAALLAEEWSPRFRRARSSMAALGTRLLAFVPTARERPRHAMQVAAFHNSRALAAPPLRESLSEEGMEASRALGRLILQPDSKPANAGQQVPSALNAAQPPARREGQPRTPRQPVGDSRSAFIVDIHPSHPVAEAIRELRTQVLLQWRQSGQKRPISLQSARRGDGRTFVACNLAIAFAQANMRTVLVDLDLRAPRLESLFQLDAQPGVAAALAGSAQALTTHKADSRGFLDVLPAGSRPPNPQELVSGDELPALLATLQERYEVVILDCPAWAHGADAQLVAAAGTDVVMVARDGETPLRQLQEIREGLERLQVRVLGTVGNER